MSYDPNNIFAKILRGELPCVKLHEDAYTLAFMDIMPSTEGHALVIPKEAAETILDLSPAAASQLMVSAQRVAKAVKKALSCPGLMLVQLNGAAAGQSIPHVHIHILPRAHGLDLSLHGRTQADFGKLEALAKRIRQVLEN
ncbi:MAG TPA: HIT family protein [Rhizomicrobium sp.]|jgi:histidine triad (HIT) family protein|nr:HIT family protein [Rhizomicrobium sp.]